MTGLLPMLLLLTQIDLWPIELSPAVPPQVTAALLKCARDDNPTCIQEIVGSGVPVDTRHSKGDQTPLMAAAELGATRAIRELVSLGADLEAVDPTGTPLVYAAWQGREETVRLLLELGANVNPPSFVDAPLFQASVGGPPSVVKLLIDAGANVNWTDSSGRTPLLLAARHGANEKLRLLISAGAKVNVKDQDGSTPLILAASKHKSTVSILLEAGADPDAVDNNGNCAWSKAREQEALFKKSLGVLEVLKSYQALRCNEDALAQ